MSWSITTIMAIAVGGGLGALLRYVLSYGVQNVLGHGFPYGTLLANTLGCLLAGFIYSLWQHHELPMSQELRFGVMVGFLGALTTFSTFAVDSLILIEQAQWLKAGLNIGLNVVVSLAAVFLGVYLAKLYYA